MKKLAKSEKGDFVIEATIVLTIVIMFVFFLLMLGFYLFQQMAVNIVANDTANSIAQIFAYDAKDPLEGMISQEDYTKSSVYRHIVSGAFSVLGIESQNKNINKAKWHVYYSLNNYQYIAPKEDPTVEISFKNLTPFKKQIFVKIIAKYDMPFAGVLGRLLGQTGNSEMVFEGSGAAVCTDLSEYFSRIDFGNKLIEIIAGSDEAKKTLASLDKITTTMNRVLDLFE